MSQMIVQARGEHVEFDLEDENGARSRFRLGRNMTTALVLRALEELSNLPPLEGELLQEQAPPLLQGWPSFQTGIVEKGDLLIAFRLAPLPIMHFIFDDARASQLAQEISEIVSMPRNMRLNRQKH